MNSNLHHISFPKLGLFLTINPIALQIANIKIYWYGIIVALAFLIAVLYINHQAKNFKLSQNDVSDFILSSSICGIISARVYYILFYPGDFYRENPLKIFTIYEGGIAIYGAVIGGILAIYITSKIKDTDILNVLDLMSLGLVLGQSIGRWGNFVNQEAFGIETSLPWGMMSENTSLITVHPCFFYESIGCAVIFLLIHVYSCKIERKSGNVFLLYIMLYGLLRTLIEGLRTDSLIIPNTSIRVSQLLSLIIFLISTIILLVKNKRNIYLKLDSK